MRAPLGKQLITFTAIASLLVIDGPARAHHDTNQVTTHSQNPSPPASLSAADTTVTAFAAGSMIIPMDGCHQRMGHLANADVETFIDAEWGVNTSIAAKKCQDNSEKDDGMLRAYSLIQRLVRDGIKVKWAIRAGKTGWSSYDVAVTRSPATAPGPVTRWTRSGGVTTPFSTLTEVRYAGAPFIIDSAEVAAAQTLIAGYSASYDEVDFHIAQVSFSAPVFSELSSLPKLAIVDLGGNVPNDQTNKLQLSVAEALMDDMQGTWWDYVTFDEVRADRLVTDNFVLTWVPPFELPAAPTAAQTEFLQKINTYLDNGQHVLFQDSAIAALEGFGTWGGSYTSSMPTPQYGGFMTGPCTTVGGCTSPGGLVPGGLSAAWDNGDPDEGTDAYDYSDPASQFGGAPWTGIGGSKEDWKVRYDGSYEAGVRRMFWSDHVSDNTKDRWDFAAWRHKENDSTKGRVYYLGGDHWRGVTSSGFRVLLNTIFVHANETAGPMEISRANPIVATVGGVESVVQGAYEYPIPARTTVTTTGHLTAFRFPNSRGHLHVTDASTLTTTTTDFSTQPAVEAIPNANYSGCTPYYNSTCRSVWTTVAGGQYPTRMELNQTNVATIGPLMTAGLSGFTTTEWGTLISRVLAGHWNGSSFEPKLGGLDRSTVAVIPSSLIAGSARPTMIYVGGTDGMLHAFCGSTLAGVCDQVGRELWAYVPRTLLDQLRLNDAIIDGSPRVVDMFIDPDGPGTATKSFRTVLMFTTGTGVRATNKTPAVYALDVTDPANPQVLWEYTMNVASVRQYELGQGQVLAAGAVNVNGTRKYAVYAQTNNGQAMLDGGTPPTAGTGPSASVVVAIDVETGAELTSWTTPFGYSHPAARDTANTDVPWQAVPGGAVGIDKTNSGVFTEIVFGTVYGDMWLVDAATGQSKYFDGSSNPVPLFRFNADHKPIGATPAIYSNGGKLFAVAGTGTYWDRSGTAMWNGATTQHGFSVSLSPVSTTFPLDDGDESPSTVDVPFIVDFTGGEKVSAQALIVGDRIYFATESSDINASAYGTGTSTGKAYGLDFGGTVQSTDTLVVAGVTSLARGSGNRLYSSAGRGSEVISFGSSTAAGTAVNNATPKLTRRLWLRTL